MRQLELQKQEEKRREAEMLAMKQAVDEEFLRNEAEKRRRRQEEMRDVAGYQLLQAVSSFFFSKYKNQFLKTKTHPCYHAEYIRIKIIHSLVNVPCYRINDKPLQKRTKWINLSETLTT